MIICILKIFFLAILVFVLLTYTIVLYEKSNQDRIPLKQRFSLKNFWFSFRTILVEYLALLVAVILLPVGFLNLKEGEADTTGQTPVLLLHGLFMNRACWTIIKLRLKLQGIIDVHTINLPPTRDIETLTEKVALKVDALRHSRNCEKVHLIGHSMGGIIARNYIQIRGGADKVDQCILLGSPHAGSKLAPFAITKLAETIMPDSDFLTNLNGKSIPKKVSLTNIYTRHDNLVIPYERAILEKATNIELTGKGHQTLLYDNTVFSHILSALKPVANENNSDKQSPAS